MFKEFKMSELFSVHHGCRLTKQNRILGNIPLITAGEQNQGIAEYIGNPEMATYKNAITIDMFGNCFYHSGIATGDDNIYFFVNDDLPERAKLYVAAVAGKATKGAYSYSKQFRQPMADSLEISLPVVESSDPAHVYTVEDIDWDYMQERIKELERDRIKELDAYLKATGLDDYELTEEDKKVLSLSLKSPHLTKTELWMVIAGFGRKSSE